MEPSFIVSNAFLLIVSFAGDMGELLSAKLASLRISNSVGGGGRGPVKAIISYVLMIFVLFIFATSGLISNANIQTQLKNGAYYAGLFSSLIAILLAIDFLGF